MSVTEAVVEEAVERLRALPAGRRGQFARFLLNEWDGDDAWVRTTAAAAATAAATAAHADAVGRYVADLRADDARGLTEPLDPDRL